MNGEFLPYLRDPETLARPWAVSGTPGLEQQFLIDAVGYNTALGRTMNSKDSAEFGGARGAETAKQIGGRRL